MPALKQEYDYYEYARSRQGAVKKAVPSSRTVKTTKTVSKKAPAQSITLNSKNLKTTTTRDVTRNATRIATRDDNFITKKKTLPTNKTSKNQKNKLKASIEPVSFNKKKIAQKPKEITLTKPKSVKNAKKLEEQKARVKEVFRNFVLASLIFGMFFLICYRYSLINESFNNLNNLKDDLKNQKTVNAQLESNIKENTDLAYIENYAKYQLGMQKPKESQVQRVSVGKQDKIILPIEIKEDVEETNFFEGLFNDIRKILD